jgi:hypothetical protein
VEDLATIRDSPRQASHEVVTLWWSLPDSTDDEVTGIEGLDEREESLIVRLYSDYCDVTDDDVAPDVAEQAASGFRLTVSELLDYVRSRTA